MAANTKIEWAHHTFNPWTGCTKISPACDHCYAEGWSKRAGDRVGKWGPGAPRVRTTVANWKQPERWNAEAERLGVRHSVFCASLGDVFDNEVPREWRDDLATLILNTPHLDWLLLTKRIGNAGDMLGAMFLDGPPDNVWIGASITSQAEADRDIPKLLAVPAAKRFLSMEPLLGPVAIWPYTKPHCERHRGPLDDDGKCEVCDGRGLWSLGDQLDESEKAPIRPGIDWVIVGGESGPNARPMHPDWARSLRDQCQAAGVPFLFKQWGEWMPPESPTTKYPGREWRDVVDATGAVRPVSFVGDRVIESSRQVVRVGKKAAGRLLDGVEHNGRPA